MSVEVPRVVNGEPMREAPLVVVHKDGAVTVDGMTITWSWMEKASRDEPEGPAYDELDEYVEPAMLGELVDILRRKRELWSTFHPKKRFPGLVTLEIDGDAPAALVKRVAASCLRAGYPSLDFVAMQLPT